MTAPVPHGYADFQVQAAKQDLVWIHDEQTIAAPKTYGPFFTGTSLAVNVVAVSLGGRFRISLGFYDSSLKTVILGSQEFIIGIGGGFSGSIKNVGPWMTIVVTPGAAGNTYGLTAASASSPGNQQQGALGNVLVSATGNAVGIGAAVVIESPNTWPGWAYWSMHQSAGTCQMSLHYTDEHGTVIVLDRKILVAGADVGQLVYLPAAPVGVQCFNTSGAATNFDAYLIARPELMAG